MRFLLDADTCIRLRRRRDVYIVARFDALAPGEAVLSPITQGELLFGAEKNRERDRALGILARFFDVVPVAPLPPDAPAIYGRIRADLSRRGELIGGNDLWIAAHALAADLVLVTGNRREFARVAGLKVEDWTA